MGFVYKVFEDGSIFKIFDGGTTFKIYDGLYDSSSQSSESEFSESSEGITSSSSSSHSSESSSSHSSGSSESSSTSSSSTSSSSSSSPQSESSISSESSSSEYIVTTSIVSVLLSAIYQIYLDAKIENLNGLWFNDAPEDISYPFGVYYLIDNQRSYTMGVDSEFGYARVQFSIFADENNLADALRQANILKGLYNLIEMEINTEYSIICSHTDTTVTIMNDNIWCVIFDIMFRIHKKGF